MLMRTLTSNCSYFVRSGRFYASQRYKTTITGYEMSFNLSGSFFFGNDAEISTFEITIDKECMIESVLVKQRLSEAWRNPAAKLKVKRRLPGMAKVTLSLSRLFFFPCYRAVSENFCFLVLLATRSLLIKYKQSELFHGKEFKKQCSLSTLLSYAR